MVDIHPKDMADKLLAGNFAHTSPSAAELSDPLVDTPMVVTLDQLRPYDGDPRVKRNPAYEDIKASIRERGLDAAPAITRRPGEDHYIIRNGGNTRLAILRDLWSETKDERFFRIPCLFRPWSERGEIIALTGHLAENELRNNLTFIERALGVERARELYEQESGQSLSQSELARRLKADGYPVSQPHISRMQEAIQYLLPAIPSVLYAGLGRTQIEHLTGLRRIGERVWAAHGENVAHGVDFPTLFQDVLALFDDATGNFNIQRMQDELIGQMSELLHVDYDTLAFELSESDRRWQMLRTPPAATPETAVPAATHSQQTPAVPPPAPISRQAQPAPIVTKPLNAEPETRFLDDDTRIQQHIVSPAPTTERLQSIQTMIAQQLGEAPPPDFARSVLQSIPVQAGSLYPISDVWHIDPGLDDSGRLRTHIAQFAEEIATEAAIAQAIEPCDDGIGFHCQPLEGAAFRTAHARAIMALLQHLSALPAPPDLPLNALLCGTVNSQFPRLSDEALVKLFRLIRLARRLAEHPENASGDVASDA